MLLWLLLLLLTSTEVGQPDLLLWLPLISIVYFSLLQFEMSPGLFEIPPALMSSARPPCFNLTECAGAVIATHQPAK